MAKELIQNIYLFRGLPANEIEALNKLAKVEKRNGGEFFFSQGDKATALYIVKYGTVRVRHNTKDGEVVDIATLATGSHFGEMAFVDNQNRTASAEAMETTEVLRIDYAALNKLFDANPKMAAHFFKAVAVFLCGRLSQTNTDLSFARTHNRKVS